MDSNHPQQCRSWGLSGVKKDTGLKVMKGKAPSLHERPRPAVPRGGRPHEAKTAETHKNVISLLPNLSDYFSTVLMFVMRDSSGKN